jgi:uncharacterized protein (TIGR02145 family)
MRRIICLITVILLFTGCIKEDDPLWMMKISTFTDSRDNRTYRYLTIGDQTWMMDNLAWLPAVSNPYVGSGTEPHFYVSGYDGSDRGEALIQQKYITYGVLYNYSAAITACPEGWHLPSDKEWKLLSMAQGMSQSDADSIGFSLSPFAGAALKSKTGWLLDGNGTNTSGFSALPAGFRSKLTGCYYSGVEAYFWTSTENNAESAWFRKLVSEFGFVYRYFSDKSDGMSVRCVKD